MWLQASFPKAQITHLRYHPSDPEQIKSFELVFDTVADDIPTQRRQIQAVFIEKLTQKNHPEGSCVQVEHVLRAKKSIFKVLVACVG